MSDIRLHTFRTSRNRNGYTRLDTFQQQQDTTHSIASGSGPDSPMLSSFNATSSARRKGKRRNQYGEGEPEEEATLLGEGEHDPGFLHDEDGGSTAVERASDTTSQVRSSSYLPRFGCMKLR
jgi:phospholipid-translocating ATPase